MNIMVQDEQCGRENQEIIGHHIVEAAMQKTMNSPLGTATWTIPAGQDIKGAFWEKGGLYGIKYKKKECGRYHQQQEKPVPVSPHFTS